MDRTRKIRTEIHSLLVEFTNNRDYSWFPIYDMIVCGEAHDAPYMSQIQSYKIMIQQSAEEEFRLLFSDEEIRKIAAGPFLNATGRLFSDFYFGKPLISKQSRLEFRTEGAFHYISAHDLNIIPVREALSWGNKTWPGYGESLKFELFQDVVMISDSRLRCSMDLQEFLKLCT